MTFAHRIAPLVILVAACERTEVHTIELTVATAARQLELKPRLGDPGGTVSYDSYAGFACLDLQDADEPVHAPSMLAARSYALSLRPGAVEATMRASIVVDTVRLGGYPRCRATEIVNFCADRDCAPLAEERRCFDLPSLTVPIGGSRVEVADKLLNGFHAYLRDGLKDALVTADAVDEEVILRMVGTTERCAELEAKGSLALDPAKLLGCNYSCPIVPTAVRGEVLLDLDAFGESLCEPAVRACAAESFSPAARDPVQIEGLSD